MNIGIRMAGKLKGSDANFNNTLARMCWSIQLAAVIIHSKKATNISDSEFRVRMSGSFSPKLAY